MGRKHLTSIPELVIIKALLLYKSYNKYIRFINISKDFKELYILYQTLAFAHDKYPEADKTVDELESLVYANYPMMSTSEKQAIADLCSQLRSVEVSDDIVESLLTNISKRSQAREIALAALNFAEGRLEEAELSSKWQTFSSSGTT